MTDPKGILYHKTRLRRAALARRDAIPAVERTRASEQIRRRLVRLPPLQHAHTIFCFVSFGSEVDTLLVLHWALCRGLTTAVPLVLGPRDMAAVTITSLGDLRPGHFGIPTLPKCRPHLSPHTIDVALVPGSAFDTSGGRIGYGGGFYDGFLARMRPDATRIGIAFDTQIVPTVPAEPHDLRLNAVVTERRVLRDLR